MRDCAGSKGTGGVIVRNGKFYPNYFLRVKKIVDKAVGDHGNIEVIMYNKDSMFARVQTVRHSTDPVAVSVAERELLEMLHLAPNIIDAE